MPKQKKDVEIKCQLDATKTSATHIIKPLLHLVGILFPHINDEARSKSHQRRKMLDVNEMYFLKSVPGMHFVILVQYAVINEMGTMTFSQKCDHRHNLQDSSECFQK